MRVGLFKSAMAAGGLCKKEDWATVRQIFYGCRLQRLVFRTACPRSCRQLKSGWRKTMLVHITTDNHVQGRERLVREVEASVEESLGRFAPQITRVEVHLSDENGKKPGDNDKRCKLEARLAGLAALGVTGAGSNLDQAVGSALEKLHHLLDHKLGRLSEKKIRPSTGGEDEGEE